MPISEKFWPSIFVSLSALAKSAITLATVVVASMMMTSAANAGDCGLATEVIPDFTLVDVNPTSTSYDQLVSRDQLLGDVIVMYWAHAT